MSKWHLIIDVALCHNCSNCFIACKDEHVGNDYPGYAASQPLHGHSWIEIGQRERGQAPMVDTAYLPKTCNQCADAPCTKIGEGAVHQRDDGIVIIDPVKAKGKKEIVASCPYGAIWWNEEEQLPQKWIFDAHLLDRGWKEPRCAQVCPTGAIKAEKISDADMQKRAEAENLKVLSPEFGTAPRIHYRNLHRFTHNFLGGTVIGDVDGRNECLEGVTAEVRQKGSVVGEARTDAFGEFKVEKLPSEEGEYQVSLALEGYVTSEISVTLDQSRYLGELKLAR
ncbi:MAG: oxidoreductase [Alphaproteobacteria bacterium]|jgi:Fe-S-cluster-containing dehydrogenase component|nr:oxidoreductase [Alphaproteobacteria bacterium]MBT4016789.1 oxidoreductase [Alphaproteobacteria bacterium]MBT5158713.1 oxidoreductase [Alphaproteobacteria bacterium]MBT5917060.1 oxidoreductase [Alphaproteobacteria bacterium]MBT6387685.1 oxidoreductase [Alphaproteobacteria bacterium]